MAAKGRRDQEPCRRGKDRTRGLFRNLALPLAGFMVCAYIFANLSITAKTIGASWTVAGLLYAAFLTGGFRRRLAKALPMHLD